VRTVFRGFLVGTLALAIAQAVLSNQNATARVGEASKWGLSGLHRLLSPDVAAIPQLESAKTAPWQQGGPAQGRKLGTSFNIAPNTPPLPSRGQITV